MRFPDDTTLRAQIESLWQTRETLNREEARPTVEAALAALDSGRLRVAEPTPKAGKPTPG